MTNFRRVLTGAAGVVLVAGMASADTIIGYTSTIGPSSTDLTNAQVLLPAWDPGGSTTLDTTMASNVSGGGGYTAGITMASLDPTVNNYTLVGFNITVKETLGGTYSVTNSLSAGANANGNVNIDTYAAVGLGAALGPVSSVVDPSGDIFNQSFTGTGRPPNTNSQGEQIHSTGGGPDPNDPGATIVGLTPGSTSGPISASGTSKFVDYAGEILTQSFVNDPLVTQGSSLLLASNLAMVTSLSDLDFFISTVTDLDANLSGGNLSLNQSTNVTEQVTVTYDYTSTSVTTTPEPATMAMFSGALLFIGLFRKKTVR